MLHRKPAEDSPLNTGAHLRCMCVESTLLLMTLAGIVQLSLKDARCAAAVDMHKHETAEAIGDGIELRKDGMAQANYEFHLTKMMSASPTCFFVSVLKKRLRPRASLTTSKSPGS